MLPEEGRGTSQWHIDAGGRGTGPAEAALAQHPAGGSPSPADTGRGQPGPPRPPPPRSAAGGAGAPRRGGERPGPAGA